jgi:hypothetical protein
MINSVKPSVTAPTLCRPHVTDQSVPPGLVAGVGAVDASPPASAAGEPAVLSPLCFSVFFEQLHHVTFSPSTLAPPTFLPPAAAFVFTAVDVILPPWLAKPPSVQPAMDLPEILS